jgi:hypothetical protein
MEKIQLAVRMTQHADSQRAYLNFERATSIVSTCDSLMNKE